MLMQTLSDEIESQKFKMTAKESRNLIVWLIFYINKIPTETQCSKTQWKYWQHCPTFGWLQIKDGAIKREVYNYTTTFISASKQSWQQRLANGSVDCGLKHSYLLVLISIDKVLYLIILQVQSCCHNSSTTCQTYHVALSCAKHQVSNVSASIKSVYIYSHLQAVKLIVRVRVSSVA